MYHVLDLGIRPTYDVQASQKPRALSRHYCPHCSRSFPQRKSLLRHQRTVHGNGEPALFSCTDCGEAFKRKDIWIRHVAEQHGSKTGTVTCDVCGKQIRVRALEEHQRSWACSRARKPLRNPSLAPIVNVVPQQKMSCSAGVEPLLACVDVLLQRVIYRQPIERIYEPRGLALWTLVLAVNNPAPSESLNLSIAILTMACHDRLYLEDTNAAEKHIFGLVRLQAATASSSKCAGYSRDVFTAAWWTILRHFGLEHAPFPACLLGNAFRFFDICAKKAMLDVQRLNSTSQRQKHAKLAR